MIFKEPPARWMFITYLSIGGLVWMFDALAISSDLWLGVEIDLDMWKEFVHYGSSTLMLWFAFRSLAASNAFEVSRISAYKGA